MNYFSIKRWFTVKFNDKQNERRVLDKTAELLLRRGIRGWNMDQLAAESGLAKNTLYRIIGSKEQLIERVIIDRCRMGMVRMVEIIDREEDYLETLEAMADEFPQYMNTLYGDFLYEIFLEYPHLENAISSHRNELSEHFTDYLKRGIDEGYLREDLQPEMMFEFLQAIILFFVNKGLKGPEQAERIHEGFRCLLYGAVLDTAHEY